MAKSDVNPLSSAYRTVAGLPERKNAKPFTDGEKPSAVGVTVEPEGGYGGSDGIDNQQSLRREDNIGSAGSEIVGTEFDEGKTDDGKSAKESIARKKTVRKQAVGPVTGATK